MTKEEIKERLVALCVYAPYGLKVKHDLQEFSCELTSVDLYRGSVECVPIGEKAYLGTQHFHVEFVKPVLRTMDSMTIEERKEYVKLPHYGDLNMFASTPSFKRVKWLCERKFDFMGLIHDGMAVNEQDIF